MTKWKKQWDSSGWGDLANGPLVSAVAPESEYVDIGTAGTRHDGRARSASVFLVPRQRPWDRAELSQLANRDGALYWVAPETAARTWVEVVIRGELRSRLLVTSELRPTADRRSLRVRTRIAYWGAAAGGLTPTRRVRRRRRCDVATAHRNALSEVSPAILTMLTDFRRATRPPGAG